MTLRALAVGVVLATQLAATAADKDTPAATATRKKLQAIISVKFDNETFRECLDEIKRQIEDAGAGTVSYKYDTGVSMNQRFTFEAKDQTVADVLDGLLKKNSLGYVVIVKEKDRYDGWLLIKLGNERGYPAGEEPKGKTADKAKAAPAVKAVPADKAATDDRAEKAAKFKLDSARQLVKDGKKDLAKERLKELIKQYPDTKAAAEAKTELEKLK